MPALRVFGRRWLMAEDDVPVPAAVMFLYHLVWIFPMIASYVITFAIDRCKHVVPHTIALSGILLCTAISAVLEAAAVVVGLRGAPFERSRRASLPLLVHINAAVHVVSLGFNIFLTFLVADTEIDLDCETDNGLWSPDAFLWVLCISKWVYLAVVFLAGLLLFNPHSDFTEPHAWEAKYLWSASLSNCFLFKPRGEEAIARRRDRARRAGANLCALFGHTDLTLTDCLLGLGVERILYRRHKKLVEAETCSGSGTGTGSGSGSSSENKESSSLRGDPVDLATLEEANHYFRFALASYGWMMHAFDGGFKAAVSLAVGRLSPLRSCCGAGPVNRRVAAEVLKNPKNPEKSPEIVFLREEGAVPDVLSYVLAVDHATESIVLAVRGALSLSDNMRDLLFEAADLGPWINDAWEGGWSAAAVPTEFRMIAGEDEKDVLSAQGDYLRTSAITLRDVVAQGALAEAATAHPSYRVVVTGHSLGAAAAFFIALRLRAPGSPVRENGRDVRCWSFSPPLGLASAAVGTAATEWCTTTACGKEIVPRYSVVTLDRAWEWMVAATARCRRHKLRVLFRWAWSAKSLDNDADLVWPEDVPLPPEPAATLAAAQASAEADSRRHWLLATAGDFGLPGRVIHFDVVEKRKVQKRSVLCSCCACCGEPPPERIYGAAWVPDPGIFREEGLQPSGRLLADHMPDHMGHVLEQVLEESTAHDHAAPTAPDTIV